MNSNLKRLTELFENFRTNFPFCAAILLPRGESGCADWRTVAAATAGNWAETSSDEPNGVEISTLLLVWRFIASARFVAIFRTKFHGPKNVIHFFSFFFIFLFWIFLNYFKIFEWIFEFFYKKKFLKKFVNFFIFLFYSFVKLKKNRNVKSAM